MFKTLLPDGYYRNFAEIPSQLFKNKHYMVSDLDQTVILKNYKVHSLSVEAVNSLKTYKEAGLKHLVFLTNTNARELKKRRAEYFAKLIAAQTGLQVDCICLNYRERKPKNIGFQRAISLLGCIPDQIVMVGDQLVADIKGGNRNNLFTVLVDNLGRYHWQSWISGRVIRNKLAFLGLRLRFGLDYSK